MKMPASTPAMLASVVLMISLGASQNALAQTSGPILPPNANCEVGSGCSRQLRANEQFLADQQRARQLRQYGIDQGRALRNRKIYPGYTDMSIPIMRPGRQIILSPNRR